MCNERLLTNFNTWATECGFSCFVTVKISTVLSKLKSWIVSTIGVLTDLLPFIALIAGQWTDLLKNLSSVVDVPLPPNVGLQYLLTCPGMRQYALKYKDDPSIIVPSCLPNGDFAPKQPWPRFQKFARPIVLSGRPKLSQSRDVYRLDL